MLLDYQKAKKLGERAYRRAVIRGQYPYLPALADMVKEVDRYPEIDLGRAEIPLDMIVGTRTSGRQNAFAANFMPLMGENTEFAAKWSHLYDAQVEESIRDPVKVYEFMNRFYVEEGNKRISVLRYVGAVSVYANVIRIRPPRSDAEPVRVYYEYLDFYKVTRSYEIVLSAPGSYEQLARILEQNLRDPWPEDLLEKLHNGFIAFKSVYLARGGRRLNMSVGDAMLIYLGVYSLDSLVRESDDEIGRRLLRLWREFIAAASPEGIALIEERAEAEQKKKTTPIRKAAKSVVKTVEKTGAASVEGAADLAGAFAGITAGAGAAVAARNAVRTGLGAVLPVQAEGADSASRRYSPAHPLRIAFLYEKEADRSGWVYGHELGRSHLKDAFGSLVETTAVYDCRTEDRIQKAFEEARDAGCGMIFATSPAFTRQALRFAVENPSIRVLNCSCNQTKHAMRFYYGKMYEAKFLMGALAASLTDDHRIGYIAGSRDMAAVSNINAFARGAQLIDPLCRIGVQWLPEENKAGEDGRNGLDGILTREQLREQAVESLFGQAAAAGERTETEQTEAEQTEAEHTGAAQMMTDAGHDLREPGGTARPVQGGGCRIGGQTACAAHRSGFRIHIISDIDMVRPGEADRRYGLYLRDDAGSLKRLAAPVWNWGVFYEIVVRRMLDGSYDNVPDDHRDRAMNYWMGLSSGLIDIILSDDLPKPSYRLMELFRKGITDGWIDPFDGVMTAQDGTTRGEEGKTLSAAEVMEMDWFMENVDGEPKKSTGRE